MYSLVHNLDRRGMAIELPTGIASLAIAEVFFKFKSFSLEFLAFLALWYVLSLATRRIAALFTK